MEEMAGLITREKEFEDGLAPAGVEIERAVNELELFQSTDPKLLHLAEKFLQRRLPDGNVERRQAKLAGEWAAARRLDVNDAMRDVAVGVEVVGRAIWKNPEARRG